MIEYYVQRSCADSVASSCLRRGLVFWQLSLSHACTTFFQAVSSCPVWPSAQHRACMHASRKQGVLAMECPSEQVQPFQSQCPAQNSTCPPTSPSANQLWLSKIEINMQRNRRWLRSSLQKDTVHKKVAYVKPLMVNSYFIPVPNELCAPHQILNKNSMGNSYSFSLSPPLAKSCACISSLPQEYCVTYSHGRMGSKICCCSRLYSQPHH